MLAFPGPICLRLICLISHFKGQALGFADQIISGDGEIFSINFSFCLSISFRIIFVDFLTSSCPGTRFRISSPCCWGFAWRQQGSRRVLVPGSPGQAFHTMKEEEVRSEGPGQDLVLEGAITEGRACPESPDLSRGVPEGVRSLQPTVRPGRGTYLWLMC